MKTDGEAWTWGLAGGTEKVRRIPDRAQQNAGRTQRSGSLTADAKRWASLADLPAVPSTQASSLA